MPWHQTNRALGDKRLSLVGDMISDRSFVPQFLQLKRGLEDCDSVLHNGGWSKNTLVHSFI